MSSIVGFFSPYTTYSKENPVRTHRIENMSKCMQHRGPDKQNLFYFPHGAFAYNELSCGNIPCCFSRKDMPFTATFHRQEITILYDGFIANLSELSQRLTSLHVKTAGLSVEELLICAYLRLGGDFVKFLHGRFALALYDASKKQLYLYRDQLGLSPLYYCVLDQTLYFSSEIKGLLASGELPARINEEGICELFALGPAHTPGCGIFQNVKELKAGHLLVFQKGRLEERTYHRFLPGEHNDSYEEACEHVSHLLHRAIQSVKPCNESCATLLSGGLDSCVVTAALEKEKVATYSLEFLHAASHFRANSFQPALDAPYIELATRHLNTSHEVITCDNSQQFECLRDSVRAHDLPAMADIDSSLLYFCGKIAPKHRILFTGECADEIFAGYPWFYRSEMQHTGTFPWAGDFRTRTSLLNDDIISRFRFEEYATERYRSACNEIHSKNCTEHNRIQYLTYRYFMQTLIDRTDRIAAFHSIDARVPFASLPLAEYLFRVPLEQKAKNGEPKHLLREFAKDLLPPELAKRPKSPFPKTYDPGYEALINQALLTLLEEKDALLFEFVDRKKMLAYCQNPKDLTKPWFGQLMAGPQLGAYILQIHFWLQEYRLDLASF